ncbi:hypothetical protein J7F02_01490 [Streptomyces sp. ISL-112]|uniref:hypothetical protein n=1 Tax=unclassified Streptomyces TaxID=2593676 RepID=UPI001BEB46BD|nr:MULTISPECIES: hypothetical protein [unclassified Streptomyces]MBT2424414.1 hypothetical protein [Streptomyces sp. ISL-112]MBT2464949.1 hypothetical protein [Streptomyces sp. ISL-63]
MGYAQYEITRNGQSIVAGYAVPATCEEPDCTEAIDRGLAHLCGEQPGGDEHGCGGYFCERHLYLSLAPGVEQTCSRCDTSPEEEL